MEVVSGTTWAIRRAKLQSNRHHQQTNTQLFIGRMTFLSPNQQCQNNLFFGKYVVWDHVDAWSTIHNELLIITRWTNLRVPHWRCQDLRDLRRPTLHRCSLSLCNNNNKYYYYYYYYYYYCYYYYYYYSYMSLSKKWLISAPAYTHRWPTWFTPAKWLQCKLCN